MARSVALLVAGTTETASVASNGDQGNDDSFWYPSISADGRYVGFSSGASNLVDGDTNAGWDVFVRDREAGTTERVSVTSDGGQGNGRSAYSAFSADGRYIAFASIATNLVGTDTNGYADVFVKDCLDITTFLKIYLPVVVH